MRKVEHEADIAHEHFPAAVAVHVFDQPMADPARHPPVDSPGGRHLTNLSVHQLSPRIPLAELPEVLRGETSLDCHP